MRSLPLFVAAGLVGCASVPSKDAGESRDAAVEVDAGTPVDAGVTDAGGGWTSLFTGTDLTGWHTWLGSAPNGQTVTGLDDDPKGVFTVVMRDGEPAIRVSGEVWGALTTDRSDFSNFELEAEYQWGTGQFPPLNFKDSGIMYLSTRAYGAVNAGGDALCDPIGSCAYMVSMEFQISPGAVGDVVRLGPISHVNGPMTQVPEVGSGWNQVRIVKTANAVEHWLNGAKVRSATGFTLNWPGEAPTPLTEGRLQLECEGTEIFFRRLRIRPLD